MEVYLLGIICSFSNSTVNAILKVSILITSANTIGFDCNDKIHALYI